VTAIVPYMLCVVLTKLSIFCFYCRIFTTMRSLLRITWGLGVFIVAYNVALIFVIAVQCVPLSYGPFAKPPSALLLPAFRHLQVWLPDRTFLQSNPLQSACCLSLHVAPVTVILRRVHTTSANPVPATASMPNCPNGLLQKASPATRRITRLRSSLAILPNAVKKVRICPLAS
jgi:hypothetical protein